MNNKLVGLLVIKRDNHENRHQRTSDIQSINWTIKKKLDLTVLLIPRLQFPSTKYKSLAKLDHDESSKEKLEQRGERGVCVKSDFSSPLLHVNSPFPKPTKSPKNILNNNIQIWLIKENIKNKTKS